MKICRITSAFPPPWTGLAPGPYSLSLSQHRRGAEVTVIARDVKGSSSVDKNAPFKTQRIPSKFEVEFSFKAYKEFRVLNENHPFDLIHGHGFSSLGILIIRKFLHLSIPVITTIHCVRSVQRRSNREAFEKLKTRIKTEPIMPSWSFLQWEAFQERFIIKNSDLLIAVSEGVKNDLIDIYKIPVEKVYVTGNGVDTLQFSPINRLSIEKTKKINLLWVGRFSGFKGESDLIEMCRNLRQNRVNFHLKMIGDGDGRLQFFQYLKNLSLENYIEIIPYIPNSQIQEYYVEAHVFILPSVSEGMPKAVLEAMACGCPIIVSDIPGCRELAKNGKNSFLIPVNRPDLLSEAVITLYKNPNLIVDMGQESRKIVEDKYTWEAVVERLSKVYETVLGREFEENRNTKSGRN